jgi:hypothetical protein
MTMVTESWSQILIPETYEYVTKHGKIDFADVTSLSKACEMVILFWMNWVSSIQTQQFFIKVRPSAQTQNKER